MSANNSQRAVPAPELIATMDGTWKLIGVLLKPPVQIIFDSLGSADVAISMNGGVDTWKTFAAGSALVLDMRGNHGIAGNFAFDEGTPIYGNGASGQFSVAYTYARE